MAKPSAKNPEPARTIANLSSKKSLALNLESASSPLSRMRGLMFRKKCTPIIFDFGSDGIWPIHSFFVAFPFDAIYLDSKMRIVAVFESVAPFQAYVAPSSASRYLLELPAGSVKKLKAKNNDALSIG